MPESKPEHYVTLFDRHFLPQGMALHKSLASLGEPYVLWVLCMDPEVEEDLLKLNLAGLRTIPLREIEREHPELLAVKGGRGRGEYCWTLTPFAPLAVFEREPRADRVTYVDADVYFFGSPRLLLAEMDAAGADVLLTDHAYAPRYRQEETSGKFCVQFLPFRRTPKGLEILRWWQERCVEWCFARFEDGKFGDQKYLDDWCERFGTGVHVLAQVDLTLAPWNAGHLLTEGAAPRGMFHFHNLRLLHGGLVRLWHDYDIPAHVGRVVYRPYVKALREGARLRKELGIDLRLSTAPKGLVEWMRRRVRSRRGSEGWSRV